MQNSKFSVVRLEAKIWLWLNCSTLDAHSIHFIFNIFSTFFRQHFLLISVILFAKQWSSVMMLIFVCLFIYLKKQKLRTVVPFFSFIILGINSKTQDQQGKINKIKQLNKLQTQIEMSFLASKFFFKTFFFTLLFLLFLL